MKCETGECKIDENTVIDHTVVFAFHERIEFTGIFFHACHLRNIFNEKRLPAYFEAHALRSYTYTDHKCLICKIAKNPQNSIPPKNRLFFSILNKFYYHVRLRIFANFFLRAFYTILLRVDELTNKKNKTCISKRLCDSNVIL